MKPYTFSGHDTFVLRHGWLKKIYDRLGELATELGDAPKGFAVPAAILFEPEQSMSACGQSIGRSRQTAPPVRLGIMHSQRSIGQYLRKRR